MIRDTVGLWGHPVDRFRVFFAANVWHVVWPNRDFASFRTADYEDARQIVVQAINYWPEFVPAPEDTSVW